MTISKLGWGDYPVSYLLNSVETDTFFKLLQDERTDFRNIVILKLLLREFNNDVNRLLRVIYLDHISGNSLFYKSVYKQLIRLIKEAIILTEYPSRIEDDGFVSIRDMENSERFRLVGIDYGAVVRTFDKYEITYNKRTYTKQNQSEEQEY